MAAKKTDKPTPEQPETEQGLQPEPKDELLGEQVVEEVPSPPSEPPVESDEDSGTSLAIEIADILLGGAELFHTPGDEPYARLEVPGRHEVVKLSQSRFRRWARHRVYIETKRAIASQVLRDTTDLLSAKAMFDAPEREVHLRTAEVEGDYFFNLNDAEGRCVRITPDGWKVEQELDIAFASTDTMLSMPVPEPGGSVELLRDYVHVDPEDLVLIVAWATMVLRPTGPFPLLVLQGEQGSGKSTAMRALKRLLDPAQAEIRPAPRSNQDLVIAAQSNTLIALDNLSGLSVEISDMLCRVATGTGFATRTLYTTSEETVWELMRPVAINGIDATVSRQDLLDRAIVVRLPRISERRDEESLWSSFERDRPLILGALLDGAVAAMQGWEKTRVSGVRMLDFARWGSASMDAYPWNTDTFMAAYADNRSKALRTSLEGSPLYGPIERLLGQSPLVEGSPTTVFKRLSAQIDEGDRRARGFPKTAGAMGKELTRLAPALRDIGIEVSTGWQGTGDGKRRRTRIERVSEPGTTGTTGTTETSGGNEPGERKE